MGIQGELSELGKTLGLLIKKEIYEDELRTTKGYKDTSLLKSVSWSSCLDERNMLLESFIRGSSSLKSEMKMKKS